MTTTRRTMLLVLAAGGLALPFRSFAQTKPARTYRIGVLGLASPSAYSKQVEEFRAGLREIGYREGDNINIDFRWAQGDYARLPELAAALAAAKPDVLVTHGTPGSRAAAAVSTTLPIVVAGIGDAVASGVAASEGRPSRNVTGLSFFSAEINAKSLETLKETVPRIRRVAVLFNPDNASAKNDLRVMEPAATALNLELRAFRVRSGNELESAFASMARQGVDAVAIFSDPMIVANAATIVRLANGHRIASTGFVEIAEAGGLLAYGVSFAAMWRRAAYFVDKILKGAKAGDLPIERATKFEQVVNMKTAKALGITVPASVLVRADKVIE